MTIKFLKCLLVLYAFLGLFFGLVLAGETQEADAAKAKSKTWKYGYKTKGIVCGDKLCSEKYGKKIQ